MRISKRGRGLARRTPKAVRPRRMRSPVRERGASATCLGLLLGGLLGGTSPACSAVPPMDALPLQGAPAFSAPSGVQAPLRWWESFEDPTLMEHVERGLGSSFTLRAAYERVQAARAIVAREGAALRPTIDGTASGTLRERRGSDQLVVGNQQSSQVNLGLEASYEVDLWGRIRSSVEARALEASATAEDYQVAAVTLSAEVAIALYRLTESTAQLALIESQLATNRDVLRVIENRFAIGQSSGADVLRQRQLVESTNEQKILESAGLEVLEHQLAVLEGRPPQEGSDLETPQALPVLPDLPAIGLPAELLQRRPDIRAAYLRLQSADSAVAAAVRDRYPRIDLSASAITFAENPSGLFDAWLNSLAGQLVGPLVDGGLRRREVDRTVAVRRQRLAEYGDAVLVAFAEVEDALARERRQGERIASLERQLALATTTYRELRNQYLNGAADFIDVLVALRNQQGIERDLLEARLLRIESRIGLHRAIAGGFGEGREDSEGDGNGPASVQRRE